MAQTTLDRDLPESASTEQPGRHPLRAISAWGGVALALAGSIILAAVVLFGSSGSTDRAPVFTDHGRIHAVENSFDEPHAELDVTTDGVFTEHGRLSSR